MYKILEIEIDRIKLKKRIRKELPDILSLSQSIKKYGLLSPIILNNKLELLAGNRRLEAVKGLGWTTIPAIILEKNTELEKLEIELEENIQRRELNEDEMAAGLNRIDKLKNPPLIKRIFIKICMFLKKLFKIS